MDESPQTAAVDGEQDGLAADAVFAKVLQPDTAPLGIQAQVDQDPLEIPGALLDALSDVERKLLETHQGTLRTIVREFNSDVDQIAQARALIAQADREQVKREGKIDLLRAQIGDLLTHAHLRKASKTAELGDE